MAEVDLACKAEVGNSGTVEDELITAVSLESSRVAEVSESQCCKKWH